MAKTEKKKEEKKKEKTPEELALEAMYVPRSFYINRVYNDQTWLAGVGPRDARIMFITPVVSEEEAAETRNVGYGKTVPRVPRITDCGQWNILKDIALRAGLDINECFVTSLVKFLPKENAQRTKPKMALLHKVLPCLEHEINEIKPDIIVCVGKLVWDVLSDVKARESDIYGLWLYNEKYNCKLYAIPHLSKTLKPEQHERFKMDIRNIVSMAESIKTGSSEKLDMQYEVINTAAELEDLVTKLELMDATVLSVDCEWGGQIHVDGLLRSLQIAWSPTQAAYIRFRDEDAKYVFDVDYKAAGAILAQWLDNPDVKYIGHHVSADLTWMSYWLGLKWRGKAIFDTEFALQCCDESIDLGLDVLALRYTNFGKYDWDLIQYRKKHTERKGTGYELVSDEILIPYA
jgi:DNA polymerase